MHKYLTIPSVTLILGSFLGDTRILFYLIASYNIRYSSWIQEGFFYACTIMLLICMIMYLLMNPIKHFSHCYQFIIMPIFSVTFMKQSMPFQPDTVINSLRTGIFVLGWVICLVMVITEYTRYPEDESQTLIKISTNLRVIKLIKRLAFALLVGFNLIQPVQLTLFFMAGLTLLQFYSFITTFSFQNPFHQYLLMLATFSSLVSWIDFILFYEGITNYAFIGEILFILVIVFSPQIFQRVLELKYQLYGEKNIQTRKVTELMAVFVVMKEIILNERKSLKYTSDFQNTIFTLLQKMVAKNRILSEIFDESNMLREKDFLSEDQLNFLKILQKRLKQNQQFIAYEFYLTTIVRKGYNFKNKALGIYYQRISDKGRISTNLFSKIEMKMLYQHLMSQLQQQGKNQIHHAVLTFSDSLNQLKTRIMTLCKHQISVVNLFQNSSNVPIQRYSGQLIERHQLKLIIKQKIDQLIANEWHIHSGTFLYVCLLYKVIFEREQIIIGEKINKNFVIPFAHESRKSKFLISQYRNISIFVFCSKQKGLILNENEYFSKTFGRTVRSAQKSKKYVSQLFLSLKQKVKHQDLIQSSTKYQGLQIHDHSSYDCWIRRRVVLKNDKLHNQQRVISIVQKVKISARIYYQQQESQAFICTIEQKDSGIQTKFLAKDLQALKKYDIKFEITGKQILQQLDEKLEIFSVINKSYNDSFIQDQISQQQSKANISQNLMFPFDFQTIQHRKIQKIQKQYDKEQVQFDSRRKINLFLIFLPILSFLVSIILGAKIDSLIKQSKQVMQYEKQIFEKTLISEKFVGLNLMLYQMVYRNKLSNQMCKDFGVDSLKKYAVQNLLQFADNNFDEIELTQIQGVDGNDQLQEMFNSRYYQFFQFKDQQIWMNYVMYASLTKSSIFEYATLQGGNVFDQWSQDAIAKAINVSELSYDGLFSRLRLKFSQIKISLQQTIEYSLIILYIVQTFIFILVLFIFYRLIGFKYNHILLLKDFKKNYVKGRVRQMDFILNQMTRLQKNQIYDIQIDKLMNLKMTRQNQQQSFTLEQFQKQSFAKIVHQKTIIQESSKSVSIVSSANIIQQQKQYLVEGNQTLRQRNQTAPIMIMFSFHKYKVLGLLLFFIVSGTLNVLHNQMLKQKTMKIFLMQDLFNDMGLLLIGMEDLLVGEVVKYKGQQIYASHDLNELWIRMDMDQLYYNRFQEKVYELFPKQTQDIILYQSYCYRALNKGACQQLKGGVLTNGLSSLVGLLRKDYNSSWDKTYSSDIIRQREICQKIIIYTNFTINQYQANLVQGYNNIQAGFAVKENQFKIADGIVSIFLIIGIGIVGEIIIGRGRKVRAEVLSMDTKINLYKQQQSYRTLLNTMYYKQQKDIAF